MWIEHELNWKNLGNVGRQRNRRRSSAVDVPRVSAVEHEGLDAGSSERTILPTIPSFDPAGLSPGLRFELLLHRRILPVHRPRVIGERVDEWPVSVAGGFPCLAERASVRRSGDRDAAKASVPMAWRAAVRIGTGSRYPGGNCRWVATTTPISSNSSENRECPRHDESLTTWDGTDLQGGWH